MKKHSLIQSISGVRGIVGAGLDPVLVTTYGAAFGSFVGKGPVVLGSDSRPSGEMVRKAVTAGLISTGVDVIDIGIVPTPTVEIAVPALKATGGICVTASHNTAEWNALKFSNQAGEFITPTQYKRLEKILKSDKFAYKPAGKLGEVSTQDIWIDRHIKKVLGLPVIGRAAIKKRRFRVVVDAINGAGSQALPDLLERLGVEVFRINCKGDGDFVHNPEPTPKHLAELCRAVRRKGADLGMACDPDADRLALVDEHGTAISEELTLTIGVLEVLRRMRGPTVINLSTSRTTADIAKSLGSRVYLAPVGEANVVEMMHRKKGVIGGEGNGGVIFPSCHAGRDALVAAGLVLSALARQNWSLSQLVETFPKYYNIKSKAQLPDDFNTKLNRFSKTAGRLLGPCKVDNRDGFRFDFDAGWLQLRSSNTEPIYRLIVETNDRRLTGRLKREVISFFE